MLPTSMPSVRVLPVLLLLLIGPSGGCRSPMADHPREVTIERRLALMGTSLLISVGHTDRRAALKASEAAVRAIEATELRLSTWRPDSELSRLNRAPLGVCFPITMELAAELGRAGELWKLTDGNFDPAVGALVEAWNLRGDGRVPSPASRMAAIVEGGYGSLELSPKSNSGAWAQRHAQNLQLEAGGFGKGVGLDRAMTAVRNAGALSARIDLGGQVALFGPGELCSIADPRDRELAVLSVRVADESLATSGNSEHGIVVDQTRYGHLLDPRTGQPALDFGSVTVFAPDAFGADALSTGFFVMGPERALALAAGLDRVELLILDTRGPGLRAIATAGLRGRLFPTDTKLRIEWYLPNPNSSDLPFTSSTPNPHSDS